MLKSCDTNIFLYYLDKTCPEHDAASAYMNEAAENREFIISDFVLTELFVLLQNSKIFKNPLTHTQAGKICGELRFNPNWQILEYSNGTMDEVWERVQHGQIKKWQIYDIRLGLMLRKAGVTEFATRNTRDFKSIGFEKLINPID